MAYCDQDDVNKQLSEDDLVQLTDDDDVNIVDTDMLAGAIADADAEIDGYCGTKYSLPFSPVPQIITKLSVDITIYNLFARRMGASEERKDRYKNAVRILKDVAKGMISLGADAPASDTDVGPETTYPKSDRIFSVGRNSDSSSGTLDGY